MTITPTLTGPAVRRASSITAEGEAAARDPLGRAATVPGRAPPQDPNAPLLARAAEPRVPARAPSRALPDGVANGGLASPTLVARAVSSATPRPSPALDPVRRGQVVLREGSSGPAVSALQEALRARGENLSVDGDFGPQTRRAVESFQRRQGLSVDAEVGRQTVARLDAAGLPTAPPRTPTGPVATPTLEEVRAGAVLSSGMNGASVRDLQRRLTERGYPLAVDGAYGDGTARGVRAFQRDNGIEQNGRVGPTTLGALERLEQRLPLSGWGEAWEDGARRGRIPLTRIDGYNVEMKTAAAYDRMDQAARASGVNLEVNSGFRTYQRQSELYRDFLRGVGNPANPPGYSNHQNGIALDLEVNSDRTYAWLARNAHKYGFIRTVPDEPWHWEYRPNQARLGPASFA